jgi:acyl-[acyl-carrier-protein] desaturase
MTVMDELHSDLEPVVTELFDRHLANAKEWFPHEFVPWSRGRDFGTDAPWDPDETPVAEPARAALMVNLLTEDNLPYYYASLSVDQRSRDSAWAQWTRQWTAEEGRHAIVLRDYLTVTRNIDPVLLERGRMTQLQQGYDHAFPGLLRGLAYVTFQELATRISHRNTGRYSDDPVADRIMVRIATDENLHMVFYRDVLAAALKLDPSAAVRAIVDEVLSFQMPGAGIPGFVRKAAQIAKAGIYDLRVHRDEVLLPILRHWKLFELSGLDATAEDARRGLSDYLAKLDEQIARFEERLASSTIPRIAPAR